MRLSDEAYEALFNLLENLSFIERFIPTKERRARRIVKDMKETFREIIIKADRLIVDD